MKWLRRLFVDQWHRKLTAVLAAVIIWILVDHSITVTRTIPNIPIRVLNIPENKTIRGLLPGGLLSKRVTLTVTGSKSVISDLDPTDIEVITDATGKGDQWTFKVRKKNLRSTGGDIDISQGVSSIDPVQLTIELKPLATAKIPINVMPPIGEPPKGFRLLDVWPKHLNQTVSGPKEQVDELKAKGIRLTFDLSKITYDELETLYQKTQHIGDDEIRFYVPANWKRVTIPFVQGRIVDINDPEADYLVIDFLKQELLPIDNDLPISVFYPIDTSDTLNPLTIPLKTGDLIDESDGLFTLTGPFYARGVSRQFLEAVSDSLQITIVGKPGEDGKLPWGVQFVDIRNLENRYVQMGLQTSSDEEGQLVSLKEREKVLRDRFAGFIRDFELYNAQEDPFTMSAQIAHREIIVE